MDILTFIYASGMIMITIVFTTIFLFGFYMDEGLNEACQDINMRKYINHLGEDACLGYNNEAHFVDMECEGAFWFNECKATIISIGDVRVI